MRARISPAGLWISDRAPTTGPASRRLVHALDQWPQEGREGHSQRRARRRPSPAHRNSQLWTRRATRTPCGCGRFLLPPSTDRQQQQRKILTVAGTSADDPAMIHQIISFCSFTTTRGEQTNNRGRLIVANAHISWGSLQHDPGRGGQKKVSLTAPWAPVPTLLTSTVSQEIPDPTVPAINSNDEKSSCVPHQEISDAAAGSWKIMSCAYARRLKIKSRQTWARRALMTWKPQYVTLWMRLQTQKWAGPHAMGYGFSCCTKLQKPISAIALGNWEASLVNPGSNNYFNRLRRQNNVQLPPMTVARPAIMSNNVWLHLVKWRGGESSLAESYCPKHREKTLHTRMDYQHW